MTVNGETYTLKKKLFRIFLWIFGGCSPSDTNEKFRKFYVDEKYWACFNGASIHMARFSAPSKNPLLPGVYLITDIDFTARTITLHGEIATGHKLEELIDASQPFHVSKNGKFRLMAQYNPLLLSKAFDIPGLQCNISMDNCLTIYADNNCGCDNSIPNYVSLHATIMPYRIMGGEIHPTDNGVRVVEHR